MLVLKRIRNETAEGFGIQLAAATGESLTLRDLSLFRGEVDAPGDRTQEALLWGPAELGQDRRARAAARCAASALSSAVVITDPA